MEIVKLAVAAALAFAFGGIGGAIADAVIQRRGNLGLVFWLSELALAVALVCDHPRLACVALAVTAGMALAGGENGPSGRR